VRTSPSSWDVQHHARFFKQENNKEKSRYEKKEPLRTGKERQRSLLLGNSKIDLRIYFTDMAIVL